MKNNKEESLINEVFEVISDGKHEIFEEKKVAYDKTTQQFSIKIPKSIALKARLKEASTFKIVLNPKESQEDISNSKFVIYLKEDKNGEGEKTT